MSGELEARAELIDRFAAKLCDGVVEEEQQRAELLLRAFLEGLSTSDLRRGDPEAFCDASVELLATARERRPGQPSVRIFSASRQEHGWASEHTVLQIVNDDMPFLVDSVVGQLTHQERGIHLLVHPQLAVRRDESGRLLDLAVAGAGGEGWRRESFMHVEIDREPSEAGVAELEATIGRVLADVRLAVEDWQEMRLALARILKDVDAVPPPLPAETLRETKTFLEWLDDHHFTYLGYRLYELTREGGEPYLRPDVGSGLGLLRPQQVENAAVEKRPLNPFGRRFLDSDELVAISKASRRATVHRRVHLDVISIKRFDAAGDVLGEARFLGLFTSMAYNITASDIPLLRRKVAGVVERSHFLPASHNAKALKHILETYPRDELFQISEQDLYVFARRIVDLQLRPRLALLVRWDEAQRFVSCMVYVPRDRHQTQLRLRIQRILEEAFHGEVTAFYTQVSDLPLARVHYVVKTEPGKIPEVDEGEVEARLAEAARSWSDRLRDRLVAAEGEGAGLALWRRYRDAFPIAYQEIFDADAAILDIEVIEGVCAEGRLGMRLYRDEGAAASSFHFKSFEYAIPAPLSTYLPRLEHMGLQVAGEVPYEIRPAGADNPVWLRDFGVTVGDAEIELDDVRHNFKEAFARVWDGDVESDAFNRLVLAGGLRWREVVVLRAYCRYLLQTGIAFSQRYMAETLARNAEISRGLVELFYSRFDPEAEALPKSRRRAAEASLRESLDGVASLDEDRILRRFLNLVEVTLRTNYFQLDEGGAPKPYLSLKLDASRVQELPAPRPAYEIFVYSPRTEAVHLRGGKVARGGIRWSDRREDFRTEILGLMKSQLVKNAVIVPVGAKGGFVVKRPPEGREALLEEGIACYKTMIRGLLDVTDNLVDGEIVPPPAVVRRDGDDPYLVVAADKGTATFSDIANRVAAEYRLWLGDAFASGGSAGYDHKKMAITARGAWESVKRHFRELGRDIQAETSTVVGVGDMSGDVFGNGMLLSRALQLVAAFNHLHIFVDPDPEPEAAFGERQRLFTLPRSSWKDYDRRLISAGGGVFDRSSKSIAISPEMKRRFGVRAHQLTPNELVHQLLQAKVDLLWFGGIGTFVKGSDESHSEVGDRANDDVRVDARAVSAQVIGEGANLAVTQAARVEYALGGGRINTDFIDNSGGVDCSDHEVNMKIALNDAVAAGELAADERDRLLEEMTEEVAELVLRDSYLQSQAISLTEYQGIQLFDEQARLMVELERSGLLDRRLQGLPDDATLTERRDARQPLSRPEIAVLLAYAKISVYSELLASDLPDDPQLVEDLERAFPLPMRQRFLPAIQRHRLRREIIATHVTNSVVNRVGPTFVTRIAAETGSSVSTIARAYTAARDVFDVRAVWEEIEALDTRIEAFLQMEMMLESVRLVERATRWFLRYGDRPFDVSACVDAYHDDVLIIAAQLEDLLPSRARARWRRHTQRLMNASVPDDLAQRIAGLRMLASACDVARCARQAGTAVDRVGRVYFIAGERFGFDVLRRLAVEMDRGSPWQKAAVDALLDDFYGHQAVLTRQIVEHQGGKARAAIDAWTRERLELVQGYDRFLEEVVTSDGVDLAMLTMAERKLRRIVEEE